MSDPVAEAAAQLAAQQQSEPTDLVGELKQVVHKAEDAIEHLIHSEADQMTQQGNVNNGQTLDVPSQVADLPNAASAAGEPIAEQDSASNADGADTTESNVASSAEPLHVRVAAHLEAIFQMVKNEPTAAVADTSALKMHIGDILHRISNGMAVTEGALVQKLEALYRML